MSTVDKPVGTGPETTDGEGRRPSGKRRQPRFPQRMAFRPDIEGMRGIAITIFILFHLDFPIPGGIAGMDVFFPMSGFLITTLLAIEFQRNRIEQKTRKGKAETFPRMDADGNRTTRSGSGRGSKRRSSSGSSRSRVEKSPGTISLKAFYGRRARRLMPTALLTIAVTLIVSKILFNELRFREVQSDAFWSTFWLENFHLIAQSKDYFAPGLEKSPLQHFWSLAVEEQFYFVWPVTLLMFAKAKFLQRLPFCSTWQSRILTATVLFGVPSLVWSYTYTSTNPTAAYFSTFTRGWSILLGAAVAILPLTRNGFDSRLSKIASWTGAALFATGVLIINGESGTYPGLIAIVPALGSCFLLVAGINAEAKTPVYRMLASRPVRWTGKVSYSLYLWHWPIIVFAAVIVPKSEFGGLPRGITLLAICFLAAWVSYSLVESPFMSIDKFVRANYDKVAKVWRGDRSADMKALAMGLPAVAVVLVIALFARPGANGVFAPPQALQAWATGSALKSDLAKIQSGAGSSSGSAEGGGAARTENEKAAMNAWKGTLVASSLRNTASSSELALASKGTALAPDPSCYKITSAQSAKRCSLTGQGNGSITWPEGVPKTVVLLGHSIAAQFRESIANVLPTDVKLVPMTLTSCQLSVTAGSDVRNRQGDDCGAHNQWAIGEATRMKPGLVIFAVFIGNPSSPEMTSLGKKIQGISPKRLYIVNAPQVKSFSECLNGTDIRDCKQPMEGNVLKATGDARVYTSRFGMTEFSLPDLVCVQSQCPPFIKGVPVRFDGQHLTTKMLSLLEPFLAMQIKTAVNSGG